MTDLPVTATYRFERPRWRVVFDLLAAPLGAVVFGGMAIALLSGAVAESLTDRLQFGGLAGFFALLLAVASVVGFRRGARRTILEVGPQGIWTPEMGHLPWSGVAEIRRESYLSPAGNRRRGMVRRERLGIVPRAAAAVQGSRSASLARRLAGAYYSYIERRVPGLDTGVGRLAPYGIDAYELGVPLDTVVERVREFHDVREEADESP